VRFVTFEGRFRFGLRSVVVPQLLVLLALPAFPIAVRADGKAACVRASEEALAARDDGKLRSARAEYVICAAETCPKALRQECARSLDEVDAALPTVVFGAKDANGTDIFDVTVSVDGERVVGHDHGRAIAFDPGPHVVRFERAGMEPVEVKVLLLAGERNRHVVASFGPPPTARTAPPRHEASPTPSSEAPSAHRGHTPAIVLGATGLVAAGAFTFFAISGYAEKSRLRDTCAHACSDDDVAGVRNRYIAADIALGVSALAFGLAAYFFFSGDPPAQRLARARTIWK
jgi:hypothetical protein